MGPLLPKVWFLPLQNGYKNITLASWVTMKNVIVRNASGIVATQEILAFCFFKLSEPRDPSIWEAISSALAVAINQWADCLDLGWKAI